MTSTGREAEQTDALTDFIVGCGDIGQRVARLEQAAGRKILALTRSATAADLPQGTRNRYRPGRPGRALQPDESPRNPCHAVLLCSAAAQGHR